LNHSFFDSAVENLQSDMLGDAATAGEAVYRSDWGRIVATLIRLVGDFDLAEESAQEAFASAIGQ
jgi:RNA polymerase sigma-70 factor (ECF subfamily)